MSRRSSLAAGVSTVAAGSRRSRGVRIGLLAVVGVVVLGEEPGPGARPGRPCRSTRLEEPKAALFQTKLYDRTADTVTVDEIERIVI